MQRETDLVLKGDLTEEGEFEGLAAVYGNVDSQRDQIEPGAFAADSGREIPLCWSHKRDVVVGVGTLEDSPEGLKIRGRLLLDTQDGREMYSKMKAGAVRGLSVGFRILEDVKRGAIRLIKAGRIAEVSLTAFPANSAALVTAVKEGDHPFRDLLKFSQF